MSWKSGFLAGLGVVILTAGFGFGAVKGDVRADEENPQSDVAIDETNFPDSAFRDTVSMMYDSNSDGKLSPEEIYEVHALDVTEMDIKSLKGIEYFPYIWDLYCSGNPIKELDLSKNVELACLYCDETKIKTLDLSQNKEITWVSAAKCKKLKTIDVSGCPKLETLWCDESALTELDLSNNPEVKYVSVVACEITKLTIGESKLSSLDCSYNKLNKLELSGCPYLYNLECDGNPLSKLDLKGCTFLTNLFAMGTGLRELDLSGLPYLEMAVLAEGGLTKLDVSNCPMLEQLVVYTNQLKKLDLSGLDSLEFVMADDNPLTEMDLSGLKNLRQAWFTYCPELTTVNASGCKNLVDLSASDCKITSVDLTGCVNLVQLSLYENQLEALDISACKKLGHLLVSNNKLKELDLSGHPEMVTLWVTDNQLSELDVTGCPLLEDCSCDMNNLTKLDITKNPKLNCVFCNNNKLTVLDVTNCKDIVGIICNDNMIMELDVTNCTKLQALDFSNNMIEKIDVSNCPELQQLMCSHNPLSELDIRNCGILTDLVLTGKKSKSEDGQSYCYEDAVEEQPRSLGLTEYTRVRIQKDEEFKVEPMFIIVIGRYLEHPIKTELIAFDPTPTPIETPTPTPTPTPEPEKDATVSDFVERLYTEALGRDSEEKGKQYWTEEITSGRWTGGAVGRYFLCGDEFVNRKLNEEDFVETLYKTFFGRESEANGKKFWVDSLKNGSMTREAVIDNFIDSKEWCNLCADYGVKPGAPTAKAEKASKNATAFATRLYTCCLGRDPEEKGLAYWALALTNLEQTGCSAAKEFFTSKEFTDLNLKDEEFVKRLYTTFMDREPEASEVSYWAGEIGKGAQTRDSVLAFFGSSEEFTAVCKSYGIERGNI